MISTAGTGAAPEPAAVPLPAEEIALRPETAEEIVQAAARRYIQGCRDRIPGFVDETYSLTGSLRLHRHALGWDMLRAPANILLSVPHLAIRLAARTFGLAGRALGPRGQALGRLGRRLGDARLLMDTDLGRELAWRVTTRLLRLPADDGHGRVSHDDALALEIMADPRIQRRLVRFAELVRDRARDPKTRADLQAKLKIYADSRTAAAELVTALSAASTGAVLFHNLTPGMVSLVPALSGAIAHQMAIASFPLGSSLGGLWYGVFPAAVPASAWAVAVGGVLASAAVLTAFAGVLADPVQRSIGTHQRRLERLLDAVEEDLVAGGGGVLHLRDHYVPRLVDLMDVLAGIARLTR